VQAEGAGFPQARRGVPRLKVSGKGDDTRYLPLHPGTNTLIHEYLYAAGHGTDENGALFRPIRNNRPRELENALTPDGVYKLGGPIQRSVNLVPLRKRRGSPAPLP
jgi:hypothetical protein